MNKLDKIIDSYSNVEWLAEQETMRNEFNSEKSFIKGYQTAEKELFTEDDVRKAYSQGWYDREDLDRTKPFNTYPNGLDYEEKENYNADKFIEHLKK